MWELKLKSTLCDMTISVALLGFAKWQRSYFVFSYQSAEEVITSVTSVWQVSTSSWSPSMSLATLWVWSTQITPAL